MKSTKSKDTDASKLIVVLNRIAAALEGIRARLTPPDEDEDLPSEFRRFQPIAIKIQNQNEARFSAVTAAKRAGCSVETLRKYWSDQNLFSEQEIELLRMRLERNRRRPQNAKNLKRKKSSK